MKHTKKTIRLQFTVHPEYADKIKRANTDPFDSDSVYLMKLIDRELASLGIQKPLPESKSTPETLNKDTENTQSNPVFDAWGSFEE